MEAGGFTRNYQKYSIMALNDVMSRQGSLWPRSRLACTLWQAAKWEQEGIHQGPKSRERSYLIFPTASLPSALYWQWQKKMICADQSLAHRRPVVAAACLKGQTLSCHLIKGLRCRTNLSFEGWLSLSDKYFLVCGARQGFWHSDSPGALGNRCHYWQGGLTATAGTAALKGPGNKCLPAPYADKPHNKCVLLHLGASPCLSLARNYHQRTSACCSPVRPALTLTRLSFARHDRGSNGVGRARVVRLYILLQADTRRSVCPHPRLVKRSPPLSAVANVLMSSLLAAM